MKKALAFFLILCLTGCGTAKPADKNILYDLEDPAAQQQLLKSYCKRMESNAAAAIKNMDDITDEIFSGNALNWRVYRDKKHPELMVYYSSQKDDGDCDGYFLSYEVLLTAKEYRPLIDDITARTGLLYSGNSLGGKHLKDDGDTVTPIGEYNGKNLLSFSNPQYSLLSNIGYNMSAGADYKDLPLRVNLYMDRDKIKYINIYFLTDQKNNILTEKNLKQLSFEPLAGELISNNSGDVRGEKDGIKYILQHNVTDVTKNMKLNVLFLDYGDQ